MKSRTTKAKLLQFLRLDTAKFYLGNKEEPATFLVYDEKEIKKIKKYIAKELKLDVKVIDFIEVKKEFIFKKEI